MAEENAQARRSMPGRAAVVVAATAGTIAAAGAAGWYAGVVPRGDADEPLAVARPSVGALLPLDPFIANLGDEDGRRYLKATLQVEFYEARVPPDFEARIAPMRDLLLTLFTSKLFAEIRTPQGKAQLREEVVARMNRALQKDLVKAVYFTEFVVQ